MTEIFRIIGKNDIHFDAGPTGNYFFTQGEPPRKLTTVLTRREVLLMLPAIPLGIRPMALKHGLSVITMELNIQGSDDADMEAKEHALIETLVETDVFFSNGGTMGTKGELQIKSDGASEVSFKSVFYGVVDELDARDVLGAVIKAHRLEGLRLTLYCEPYWRPGVFNYLFNGGFEHWDRVQYGGTGADTEPDGWIDLEGLVAGVGTNNMETNPALVHSGDESLRITVAGINAGDYKSINQSFFGRVAVGVTYTAIFWLLNPVIITNGTILLAVYGDVSGWSRAYEAGAAHADWTRYTCTFTPDVADTALIVRVGIQGTVNGCNGTIYLDDFMIVRGTVIPDDFIEWHPNPGIRIGPNVLSNAGFELWTSPFVDNEPDCWSDSETGGMVGTNNREAIEVLQGCYALEIDVTGSVANGDDKGVYQDIEPRLVADTEYVLIGWVKNDEIINGQVQLLVWGSVSGLMGYAVRESAAHDEWTRYALTFTPAAGDVAGWLRIFARITATGPNCVGTVYFDKLMVIEASVYNGHSFAPEEWTGCGWIYNHLDAACDGAGACHVNYLDITDLRSDVDTRLRIEMESLYYDTYGVGELTVARRTDPCLPCQFVHVLESEDGAEVDWTDTPDATRADCQIAWNAGADLDGHIIWDYTTLGYNLACQKGRFRVLGAIFVDYDGDADENIKFKATVGIADAYQESRWLQPLIADTWHWLDFGVFEVTGQFWGDELPSTLYWRVDYLKEASDDVGLDFVLLLPEDESVLRILLGEHYLLTKDYTVATIAFAATTPGTITDTANGLAIFETGDKIQVIGSASNDGFYTVSTGGVAGTIRTTEETVLEALGDPITIASYQDVLWDNTFDFTLAVKRSYQDTFVYHPPVQAEPLALKPEEQNRLIFAIGHYVSAAFPYKGCLVHEDNDEHMLVSLKYLPQFVSPLE